MTQEQEKIGSSSQATPLSLADKIGRVVIISILVGSAMAPIFCWIDEARYVPQPYSLPAEKRYRYDSVKNIARISDYHYNFYIPDPSCPQQFKMVSFTTDDPILVVEDAPPQRSIWVTYAYRCSQKEKCAENYRLRNEKPEDCRKRLCRWVDGVLHLHSVNEINHVLIKEVETPSYSSSSYQIVTSF